MKSIAIMLLVAVAGTAGAARVDVAGKSARSNGSRLRPGATVPGGSQLATGSETRTQLSVGDQGSVVRAGSKTDAYLQANEKNLDLKQGILLVSSGRGALRQRESVSIDTKEATATTKGTMAVAYQPEAYMKVTCIEGKVTVRLKALAGEFVQLVGGQMVIINPTEKRLPEVVEFDLGEFSRTSSLLGNEFSALASADSINNAISKQARDVAAQSVVETSLVLEGAGPEVVINDQTGIEAQRPEEPDEPEAAEPPTEPPDRPPPSDSPPPSNGGGEVPPTSLDFVIDATTVFDPALATMTTPGRGTIQGNLTPSGTIYSFPNNDPVNSPELLINNPGQIPPSSSGNDIYNVSGLAQIQGLVQNGGNLLISAANRVDIVGADIFDASSSGASLGIGSPAGISVTGSDIGQVGDINLNAQGGAPGPIDVNSSIIESRASDVSVISGSSNGSQAAITIRNSSELLALASAISVPTGNVRLLTQGGRIVVDGSNVEATNEILIDTQNPGVNSLVELRNATMSADVIRARGYNNGLNDALVIEGGSYSAARMIRFYAEGASTLRFRGNVNISSIEAIFAGQRVSVDAGGVVTASGVSSMRVFADDHDYNRTGRGNINASGQLIQSTFDARPPF